MKYTFMQKNNKVMDVEMDPYYGDVEEILQVHDPRRVPLSVQYRDKRMSCEEMNPHFFTAPSFNYYRCLLYPVLRLSCCPYSAKVQV